MPNRQTASRHTPVAITSEPETAHITARIPVASAVSGISRSVIYREASKGNIKLVKLGRVTLVDMASLRAFLASLPPA